MKLGKGQRMTRIKRYETAKTVVGERASKLKGHNDKFTEEVFG